MCFVLTNPANGMSLGSRGSVEGAHDSKELSRDSVQRRVRAFSEEIVAGMSRERIISAYKVKRPRVEAELALKAI